MVLYNALNQTHLEGPETEFSQIQPSSASVPC